jgi:SAM-dependent methyltransferase
VPTYQERFERTADVESYALKEYGPDSYSSFIWDLEKPLLQSILARQRSQCGRIRQLDFACGTGRILSFTENLVDESEGVDISSAMISRAKQCCRKSKVSVGDIVRDHSLACHRYDVITAFRFFLNAEDSVRRAVLQALRARINNEHGLLVADVHGNSCSLRHLTLAYRKWRSKDLSSQLLGETMLAESGLDEIVQFFRAGGFAVREHFGFGILPQFVYRTPAAFLARWLDRAFAASPLTKKISINLVFVCTPLEK